MFDELFDTPQQILSGVKEGAVLSNWERQPRNCAFNLPLPQKQRKKGYPIGLKNQGATCYLNSFLQILFHTPQLRKTILDLPLCKENIETKSDFVHAAKHNFLFGFQKLFSEMSLRDAYAVQTDYLNKAFGWQGKEHVQQQDMTEAMKIIFDTMERALFGTQFQSAMKNLFKGTTSRYKSCQTCSIRTEKQEDFYDINVQVANYKSLDQSLMGLLAPEVMQGDNKIFCDVCQSKQDMWLGTQFKHFPNVLVLTLNRFTFDYETFDRVKLNSYFEFNLEQKFTHLIDEGKDEQFQLYGIIVHRGSAHGGHYFCYIRDILHESNWQRSIQEAHVEQQKRKKQKNSVNDLTEEQKKKQQQLQKQDKVHKLKEPQNKKLLQNWYELNDSIATAIDAQKITSKYQGSESAYILFYRRKGTPVENLEIKVPQYFKVLIEQQNQKVLQERKNYEFEKEHIIFKINGNDQKLNVQMTIKSLMGMFCPNECYSLVMQSTHNNLPYYPIQLNALQKQFGEQDTIQKLELIHQSSWKTYLVTDQNYQKIKENIGRQKLPFQVNILFDGNKSKLILYQDQTLTDFRKKIETQYGVPYENQIVQLVTPYKQIFVTDDLKNDDALLKKLGFIHESQIIIKNISPKADDYEELKEQKTQKIDKDLLCFVVERDDQIGIKRFYFSKYETLEALLKYIIKNQGMDEKQAKRLRNLNGNRLYYIDHYSKQLLELDFTEELIKLRIQRGQIPIKGDICVKAKLQSKFQDLPQNTIIQKIFDPNNLISELKKEICNEAKLSCQLHRIYLTDWMGEPVRSITKENQSIFEANFSRQETICLRDIQSPIGSELLHFQIFITETGSPDNISSNSFHVKTEIYKTILQFKQKLLGEPYFNQKNLKPKQLRVRELKSDYMFGNIWRNHQKLMKDVQINTNKLVVQIMGHQQQLRDDQIVLILKQRNIQKKLYEGNLELIFQAGKQPKLQDLQQAVKTKLNLSQDYPLLLIKYFNYNFEWLKITKQKPEKKSQTKQDQNKNKGKNKKGENKNQKKNQPKLPKEKKQQVKIQANNKPEIQENVQQKMIQNISQKQPVQQKEVSKQTIKQPNVQKKRKEKKAPQNPIEKTDYLNLRKAPTLLKDGDWIGWANQQQVKSFKDQLQTQQDLSLQYIKKTNKKTTVYRRQQGGGFVINVGF